MKKEIIVRYSYAGVVFEISRMVSLCVEDKCAKLEREKARFLLKRVLESLGAEAREETVEEEKEAGFFEPFAEAEAEAGEGVSL